jgi:ribonuclease T2
MFRAAACALFLLLATIPAPAKDFDYYTLALSWSPTWCGIERNAEEDQCQPGRRFAFVVHGLWPQYEKGWPQNCGPVERLPGHLIDAQLDIMPAKFLVIHQWRKHGTCSGLKAGEYFSEVRDRFEAVRIPARYLSPAKTVEVRPAELINDFIKSNKGLTADMLSVQCGGKRGGRARLTELRICMGKEDGFDRCGENERRSCQADTLVLPPVR